MLSLTLWETMHGAQLPAVKLIVHKLFDGGKSWQAQVFDRKKLIVHTT